MKRVCATCAKQDTCFYSSEKVIDCTHHEPKSETNHERLFGTPERAANTLKNGTPLCGWCDKQTCEENGGECSLFYYDVLLEWLKGEAK